MASALCALVLASLGYGVVVPQLPALAGSASPGLLSALFVGYAAAKIGAQIPGGLLVDRAGARQVLLAALAVQTAATAAFAAGAPAALLIAARVGQGAATGLIYPAVFAVAASRGGSVGRRLGVVGGSAVAGTLGGYALAGALAPALGARFPVAVVAAATALGGVAVWLDRGAGSPAPKTPRRLGAELASTRALAGTAAFAALLLPVAFNKLGYSGYQAIIPLVGPEQLGLGARGVSGLFAAVGLAFAAGQPLGGALADRWRFATGLAVWVPVQLAAMATTAVATTTGAFAAALVAYAAASSVLFAFSVRALAELVGEGERGAAFGTFATLSDLATVAGPPLALAGYALAGTGALAAIAALGAPVALAAAALSRRAARQSRCT